MTNAKWTQDEISEGCVIGGEKIHGYTPDGNLLCGAHGEEGSDPYSRNLGGHGEETLFTDVTENGCLKCVRAWKALSRG